MNDLFNTMTDIVDTANKSFSGKLLSRNSDSETSKIAAKGGVDTIVSSEMHLEN